MKVIATYDIGTTAVKGVLVTAKGRVVCSKQINITTNYDYGYVEQSPDEWYRVFCEISKVFVNQHCNPKDVIGIVMSGQMQDLIVLDEQLNPLCNAILYSDNRAEREAQQLIDRIGMEKILQATANDFNGTMPLAKLLWLKNERSETYRHIHKVLFCAKDYCIAKLTGKLVTDVTTASTTGMADIRSKEWWHDFLAEANINTVILPDIKYAHERVGVLTEEAAKECAFSKDTLVYTGTGDAGATTLASGICEAGDYNINLGTSGWVACVSDAPQTNRGVFNLAAMQEDTYITVVPFLNAGNVHKWIAQILSPEDSKDQYEYIRKLLEQRKCGSGGLMFLPYLVGERFPVMDGNTKGCFIGATPETSKADFVSACLEGVGFSIRQGIEAIGLPIKRMTLIGGGAKVSSWCQIFADMMNVQIEVYKQSEYMPSISIASSVLLEQNAVQSYESFHTLICNKQDIDTFLPNKENVLEYNSIYEKYKSIYPSVKNIFYV